MSIARLPGLIALLAGHVLDMKSGVDFALMQRGAGKIAIASAFLLRS